jgi:hypothetical protein
LTGALVGKTADHRKPAIRSLPGLPLVELNSAFCAPACTGATRVIGKQSAGLPMAEEPGEPGEWRALQGCTGATLTITNADSKDLASYRCVVTNVCGSATSSAATLRFESVTCLAGNQVRVVLSGEPGTSVIIQKSSDLESWLPLTNLVNTTGTVEFTRALVSDGLPRFYRASQP